VFWSEVAAVAYVAPVTERAAQAAAPAKCTYTLVGIEYTAVDGAAGSVVDTLLDLSSAARCEQFAVALGAAAGSAVFTTAQAEVTYRAPVAEVIGSEYVPSTLVFHNMDMSTEAECAAMSIPMEERTVDAVAIGASGPEGVISRSRFYELDVFTVDADGNQEVNFHHYVHVHAPRNTCCQIAGCTKPYNEHGTEYVNYDTQATFMPAGEEETCVTALPGCSNPNAINFEGAGKTSQLECFIGSHQLTAIAMDARSDIWHADHFAGIEKTQQFNAGHDFTYSVVGTSNGHTLVDTCCWVAGCPFKESLAGVPYVNYDAHSNFMAGPEKTVCHIANYGCNDPAAINYDADAIMLNEDGSHHFECHVTLDQEGKASCCHIPGCTNSSMTNWNPAATLEDGSCFHSSVTEDCFSHPNHMLYSDVDVAGNTLKRCFILGCTDASTPAYQPEATVDDGSCLGISCPHPLAVNFDVSAGETVDPASVYTERDSDGNMICWIPGCTNKDALNYDEVATFDDGSCDLGIGCMNPKAINYKEAAVTDCVDPDAQGCFPCQVFGCTDSTMTNYDPEATFDSTPTSCYFIPEVEKGCTNPVAINWKETAELDDGSCIILGCMDKNATNYMKSATTDDNSCYYDRQEELIDAVNKNTEDNAVGQSATILAIGASGVFVAVMIFVPLTLILLCLMCGMGSSRRKVAPSA
jgi:hypothetical protein